MKKQYQLREGEALHEWIDRLMKSLPLRRLSDSDLRDVQTVSSSYPVGKTAKAHASSPSPPTCSASIDCHRARKTNWRRR